ncbi:MAG: ABC transporter ATP-binding protein [Nitrososphaeria archaeon]
MGLRVEGVSKAWRGFALTDINLEISDGEYFALLGPTGAGKSLLLEVIEGFYKPDKGKIFLNGKDVTSYPPERRKIGYVPQKDTLFPHMTVWQNIEFGLKMQGKLESERQRKVNEMSLILGLEKLENRFPPTLSGGEKQKVALARVLAIEPELVLLDEPLSSMDTETRQNLREELKRINKELKFTTMHVTHDQLEAFYLAKRIGVIRDGRMIRIGETREIFENPQNSFLARFLGYENIHPVRVADKQRKLLTLTPFGHQLITEGEIKENTNLIGIHPSDITISRMQPYHAENLLKGMTKDYSDLGPTVMVTVDAGPMIKAAIPKRTYLNLELYPEQEVWLSFTADSVKILE